MKMKKVLSYVVAVTLLVSVFTMPAVANVTTGSWFMDQSNTFADGINYGQVDITANDTSGEVSFTVDAFIVGSYGDPCNFDNFGIQSFGFNTNIASDPCSSIRSKITMGI